MSFSPPPSKRWQINPALPPEAEKSLNAYPPILRQVLYNRGYTTAEAAASYLEARPPLESEPDKMLGIPQAVERIRYAIRHQEPIAVYGDYDADGVTATALMTLALQSMQANVTGYIPNRFDEGYGLNNDALSALHSQGVRLVITVDCGVRSPEEAEHARRLGLDLIITDHHTPGEQLPEALAVINPKQAGDAYPDQNLAGVGIAYKLAQALLDTSSLLEGDLMGDSPTAQYLDLVALGTVTDLAPLVKENRALVRTGLEYIHSAYRLGLRSLMGAALTSPEKVNAEQISFIIGPRLNAAGRLDSALAALELLTTQDVARAAYLAQTLDNQNRERQQITREIQAHAEQLALAQDPQALLLFATDEKYNPGVIGLAASRLTEQYYRPAIVASRGEDTTRGSCRSIAEFHITQALDECADLLVRYGGHAAAAGFTVSNDNLPELIERLQAIARRQLETLDLRPTLQADAQVELTDLKPGLLKNLERLEPTGFGNPPAVFVTRGVRVSRSRTVGKEDAHLKLTVTDGRLYYDAIAFRQGYHQAQMPLYVDLMFTFEKNEYNGSETLQLNVRDIKPAGAME
jgi:single-stranded-DNA-specific exonuclease